MKHMCLTKLTYIYAYTNMYTNFIYHKDLIKILEKVYNKFGVLNVGGPSKSVYDFVKKDNPNISKKKIILEQF